MALQGGKDNDSRAGARIQHVRDNLLAELSDPQLLEQNLKILKELSQPQAQQAPSSQNSFLDNAKVFIRFDDKSNEFPLMDARAANGAKDADSDVGMGAPKGKTRANAVSETTALSSASESNVSSFMNKMADTVSESAQPLEQPQSNAQPAAQEIDLILI